jgi:hypothetical protein
MENNTSNFFSRGDLGGINPELFKAHMELAAFKNKVRQLGEYEDTGDLYCAVHTLISEIDAKGDDAKA